MVADGLLKSATALHQSGKLDEAEKGYRLVIRFDPGNADARNLLGQILGERKEYDQAIDLIHQAIAIDATSGLFHFNLGNVLQASHRYA